MLDADVEVGQLTLPGVELPPFAPRWPTGRGLQAMALDALLEGQSLDHPGFFRMTGSWRLAAVVHGLAAMGWPICKRLLPAPVERCPGREVAGYFVKPEVIAKVRSARGAV